MQAATKRPVSLLTGAVAEGWRQGGLTDPVYWSSTLLGHADIKYTTVYLHLSQRHLHAVTNPLDRLSVSELASVSHCPKCQTNARDKWLAVRQKEVLDVPYVHAVFTEIAADPKHLGTEIGFLMTPKSRRDFEGEALV